MIEMVISDFIAAQFGRVISFSQKTKPPSFIFFQSSD